MVKIKCCIGEKVSKSLFLKILVFPANTGYTLSDFIPGQILSFRYIP